MNYKIQTFSFLTLVLMSTGCQSGVTNIPVSRNSETGQAIARMNDAEKLYNKRVQAYRKAMMAYEAANNGDRRNIYYSSLSQPIEVIGPKVEIRNLQGAYRVGDYVDYKVRITYEDEAHRTVSHVEILEKLIK